MPAFVRGLTRLAYDELCGEVSLGELSKTPSNAICRIAEAGVVRPTRPRDLAGIVPREGPPASRASFEPETWWTRPFATPELYIAGLHDVTCFGGRIRRIERGWHETGQLMIVESQYLVDDSFYVRDRSRSLPSGLVRPTADDGYELVSNGGAVEEIAGPSFLIGSAHGHFGHFLMEGLSRLWALEYLAREDLKFVIYEPELADWQLTLLAAAGVDIDRIVHPRQPTRFERLIVPARAFNLHRESSPQQDRVWEQIGDRFDDERPASRIYLSRSRFRKNRLLVNEAEVERAFAQRGFDVVHPQELPLTEQIALCRSAELLAGNAGSGMYLAAFQQAGRDVLVAAPRHFAFRDDQLIAHHRRARLSYVMGDRAEAQDDTPPRHAAWHVDLDRLETALATWLGESVPGDRG